MIDYDIRNGMKRMVRSKTKTKKIAAGIGLKEIMKDYKIQSTKVLSQEMGISERTLKRILLFTDLNAKTEDKPNWMRSVIQMQKEGWIRADGSKKGLWYR